ncbi:DgyrCDS7355 [Dimorphilus gyrociliatus]|uniref:DgyrCDS7355 n=1 Tax=Dimorphilus gyrociliatus TaxID=2664684 RepID=A0A7I8VVS1_9ANNE|nr:DgyrCDS7355 [Dimorphilus gyrociliatus]
MYMNEFPRMASSSRRRQRTSDNDKEDSSSSTIEGFRLPKANPAKQQKKSETKRKSDQSRKRKTNTNDVEVKDFQLSDRLQQVRQYIRQTSNMLRVMKSAVVNEDDERILQVEEMLQRLKEQERKYVQMLFITNSMGDQSSDFEFDRPMIESALGRHTDTDYDDDGMENGISALQEQTSLLRQVLHRREELRALQGRQAVLLALQGELGQGNGDMNIDAQSSDGTSQSDNEIVSPTNNATASNSSSYAAAARLNYVRNVGDVKSDFGLEELQNQKYHVESLLNQLQSLKVSPEPIDMERPQNVRASHGKQSQVLREQRQIPDQREVQAKMKKLEEVKRKLSELKDLVQFYQAEGDDSLATSNSEITSTGLQFERLRDAEVKLQQLRMAVEEAEDGAAAQVLIDPDAFDGDDEDDEDDDDEIDSIEQNGRAEIMDHQAHLAFLQNQLQLLNEHLEQVERSSQSTGVAQTPGSISVTFQEPLPTASNDEIYDRMRQQRILQEQIRDQKKAFEDMVSKPRRIVDSRNTRLGPTTNDSEVASAAATSVHSAAAATWGGSENSGRRTAASNGSIHSDDTFIIGGTSGPCRPPNDKQSKKEIKELKRRIDSLTETVSILQRTNNNTANEQTTATLQQQHVLLAMQHCLAQLSQQQRDVTKSQSHLNKLISNRTSIENQSRTQKTWMKDRATSGSNTAIQEKIYSEVATLISFNENRPHFLLDAVRYLQRLNTDLLRQRALYNLRDVVGESETSSGKYTLSESDRTSTPPFAHDSLGETIINREEVAKRARNFRAVKTAGLDTNALDNQVKCIMREVTGAIRAHANDICSTKMLQYLEQVVLHSVRRYTTIESHSNTIEKQLSRVLRDSLTKYNSRAVQECCEELMIDISELLFNELAFARLLHGLNEPNKRSYTESTDEVDDDIESEIIGSAMEEEKLDSEAEAMERKRDDEMAELVDSYTSSDEDEAIEKREVELSYAERKPVTLDSEEDEAEGIDETAEVIEENDTAVRREQEIGEIEITIDDIPKEGLNVFAISGLPLPTTSMLAGDGDSLQNPIELVEQTN